MSGYPYGYPYQGQPPPQQYPPYQPHGAYPPPANDFGMSSLQSQPQQQQHYALPTTSYHANAQSAYDYNASSIPGLGTPSSINPPPFPLPYTGAWDQSGYGSNAPQVPYHAYAPTAPPSSTPTTFPYPPAQASVSQVLPPATPSHTTQSRMHSDNAPKPQPKTQPVDPPNAHLSNTEVQEEGEIDDGYFDDLYDDASKAASATNETLVLADKSSGNLVDDGLDQEPNFYDTDMEDVSATQKSVTQKPSSGVPGNKTQDKVKLQGKADSDRSRSYSPHLSPTENGSTTHGNAGAGAQLQQGSTAAPTKPSPNPTNRTGSRADDGEDAEGPDAAVTSPIPRIASARPFTSVFEASNEAKKAILKLLPHGVKYQTYIDEGFDAKLIKDLFTQLNLPTDTTNSGVPEKPATTLDKGIQPGSNQSMPQTQTDARDEKQEARKDKIARLMAEKKAKLAAASNNTGAATELKGFESSASAVSTLPAKPPITRAEKDRLLQQKVEALRNKAREAKKLAHKSVPAQISKSDAIQKTSTPQVPPMTTQSPVASQSTSDTPISNESQSAVPSSAVSVGPSVPRAPQINQRKRPVAADFMDYPPLPVKRPSLANRQASSLVISVSDDEDDEDVEMEVDSATEDSPASLPQALNQSRRGPSIRDFPPLSNVKNTRQLHSPVNGSSTPGAKNANVDLESKERAILEMQKKIKELEAKKEAKARSGNVTPQSPSAGGTVLPEQAVQTPARRVITNSEVDQTTPSAQLLQEAEAANSSMPKLAIRNSQIEDGRHSLVPNVQVSGKSAKALEKAERLRRMQEEMQKLQAEIDLEEDDVEAEEQGTSEEIEAPAQAGVTQAPQAMSLLTRHEPDTSDEVNLAESSFASMLDGGQQASKQFSPDAQAMQIDSSPESSGGIINTVAPPTATMLIEQLATHTPAGSYAGQLPDDSGSANPSYPREQSAAADLSELDDYEPPEPNVDTRVGADSPRFSPAPAAQNAKSPRGEEAEKAREAVNDGAPTRQTTFAPYESPLRYYHAYRFHSNYNDGVQGGLKSLTYSNRIDPNKEMCPDEWEGNDCPRGDACQFQHFQSIIAPDSEIILELGSSDEFTGEQKREFNNGLREVVSSFQKSKVRDFRTIAQAIVDFRHRFLGDPSKVLRLEGVNI